jgi:hypothetical protein
VTCFPSIFAAASKISLDSRSQSSYTQSPDAPVVSGNTGHVADANPKKSPAGVPPMPHAPIQNKIGLELAIQKRKIKFQKEEIRKLKDDIIDLKSDLADAKAKGFTQTNRV